MSEKERDVFDSFPEKCWGLEPAAAYPDEPEHIEDFKEEAVSGYYDDNGQPLTVSDIVKRVQELADYPPLLEYTDARPLNWDKKIWVRPGLI